ncbi:MAG: hypothetical protein COA86_10360 [Kangiella sp.]|nr:MAG: hypothetical protein COA86_10360 [Kangiella sp.]
MKRKILSLLVAASLSQTLMANESPEEVSLLKQQIKLLTERLDKLEESPKKIVMTRVKKNSKKQSKTSLSDRISFKVDFRERYEIIDQEGIEERDRNRLRLRASMKMQVDDSLSFTLGMATGGDDPVSTNQTLDTGSSTKDIRLNLAHFDYKFNDSLSLTGGKMNNPFYKPGKTPAFWDSDLTPEGFALKFKSGNTKGVLVGFSLEERKADSDTYMLGGQITHDFKMSDSSKLIAGVGYYNYTNLQGFGTLYDSKPRGNSVDANGNYLIDFNIAEFLVEFKTKVGGQPLSFFGNLHKNTAADDLDTSIVYGVNYGKVKAPGSWKVGLSFIDNEADSVIGLFNDSDFAGGNTDSKGFLLKYGYGIKKNLSFGLAYISSEFGQSQTEQTEYNRLQLDLKMKFK